MTEHSKTVDNALTLLGLLAEQREGATAASLARTLGLSRSAVARLLASLEAHGLARRRAQGWGPGLGLLTLVAGIEPQLRAIARAELERLAARFDETAVLTIRDGDEAVAVDQVVPGTRVVQVHYGTGTRHALDTAASGRALRSSDPTAVVRSEGELEPGVRGVAAPVLGPDGRTVASIAVVAPAHRFPPEDQVADAVTSSAQRISTGLSHRAAPAPRGEADAALPAGG